MSAPPWLLQQDTARLQTDHLTATLDLAHPEGGLAQLSFVDTDVPSGAILALGAPFSMPPSVPPLTDRFRRGNDVGAVYDETGDWPVRVDALWRVVHGTSGQPAIELVVSVRTSQLSSRPVLHVHSTLPADEVLWIESQRSGISRVVTPAGGATVEINASDGLGCPLWRISGTDLSYAEMVHPTDFRQARLGREVGGPMVRSTETLFADSLEKGVILRGRVRGLFVPRAGDIEQVAHEFLGFAAEEPLLGV